MTVLEVRPFTGEQVKRFISNWYVANEVMSAQKDDPGVRMAAQEGAEDFLQRLRDAPALLDLAVNPLLLTMIATVHRYKSSLPGRRVELYKEICEVFLGKRQQARGLALDLTPAQKQRVLQPLAYAIMRQETREFSLARALAAIAGPLQLVSPSSAGADFLKMIEHSSGLLLDFSSIDSAFRTKAFTFDCGCTDSAYSYVYPSQPYIVYLCNAFWSAPNTGTDSKAGTLVHETSHFNVVAGTDDWAYGQTACRSLATRSPKKAVDNADSHEYFAENTPSQN